MPATGLGRPLAAFVALRFPMPGAARGRWRASYAQIEGKDPGDDVTRFSD